jgi:hypothetical protein
VEKIQNQAEKIQKELEEEARGTNQSISSDSDDSSSESDDCVEAFQDSVTMAIYYDLKTKEFIGPLSIRLIPFNKKQVKKLNHYDPSTCRAIEDAKKIMKMDKESHIICVFSK